MDVTVFLIYTVYAYTGFKNMDSMCTLESFIGLFIVQVFCGLVGSLKNPCTSVTLLQVLVCVCVCFSYS